MGHGLEKHVSIYVAGGKTLIGAAILHELKQEGFSSIVCESRNEPVLTDADQVDAFFYRFAPVYVFVAAGKSGVSWRTKNIQPELIRDNLLTTCHVVDAAYRHKVKKLLFLASSCSYPKHSAQPMYPELLLTGQLEPTDGAPIKILDSSVQINSMLTPPLEAGNL